VTDVTEVHVVHSSRRVRVETAVLECATTMPEVDAARELQRLEARLVTKFCPPLRPTDVTGALAEALAAFEGARVRAYLVVLIERHATGLLRVAMSARRPDVVGGA